MGASIGGQAQQAVMIGPPGPCDEAFDIELWLELPIGEMKKVVESNTDERIDNVVVGG